MYRSKLTRFENSILPPIMSVIFDFVFEFPLNELVKAYYTKYPFSKLVHIRVLLLLLLLLLTIILFNNNSDDNHAYAGDYLPATMFNCDCCF